MIPTFMLLTICLAILNFSLSRWLFGERRKKISETDGEKHHRWIIFLCVFISLAIMGTVIGLDNHFAVMWLLVCTLIVIYGIQSFMEWKYLKGSKQFLIPLMLMAMSVIGVLAIFFISDLMKYTTFQEVVSDQLHEETEIRRISIRVNELNNAGMAETIKKRATINDDETIDRILQDFSEMELKKDDGFLEERKYYISIVTKNKKAEDYYKTEDLVVYVGNHYISISEGRASRYRIVSETDHLQTIESLVKSDKIDWSTPGTD
ncbi:DUF4181 domain-containing protein [Lentibacillus juripiscarius]|uniref:DUF4181 domain-containing protein n=1 Tax=Lentibacillus juripiscarius TaxID=257446 RepID=A0ABW5V9M1_9BACI